MTTSFPLVFVLGLVTVMLVRSRDVRAWQAIVIGLFGFNVAMSPIGWAVLKTVEWMASGLPS
ncbi:hypothetical protein GCM10027168_35590 [Streptomyces capparidis]